MASTTLSLLLSSSNTTLATGNRPIFPSNNSALPHALKTHRDFAPTVSTIFDNIKPPSEKYGLLDNIFSIHKHLKWNKSGYNEDGSFNPNTLLTQTLFPSVSNSSSSASSSSFSFPFTFSGNSNSTRGGQSKTQQSRNTKKKGKRRQYKPRRRKPKIPHKDVLDAFDNIVLPIAFAVGILGSCILIPVFSCTPLKSSALSHYLIAIGVVDLCYLLANLPFWISKYGYRFNNVIGVCQLTMFTLRIAPFMSAWYLFAATGERFLVHFGSRSSRVWCSTFRTKCIIIGFFVLSLVGFLHYIWLHVVDDTYGNKVKCVQLHQSAKHIEKLSKIELVVSKILPMPLIALMDIALLAKLIAKRYCRVMSSSSSGYILSTTEGLRKTTNHKKLNHNGGGGGGSRINGVANGDDGGCDDDAMEVLALTRRRSSRTLSRRSGDSTPPPPEYDLSRDRSRATLVVIISGFCFLGFLLPTTINRSRFYFGERPRFSPDDMFNVLFFEKMEYFNYVFKFILYLILLRKFRNGLLHIRKCRRKGSSCQSTLQETVV